jgi:NADH-quinone oxidoreductase subunit E
LRDVRQRDQQETLAKAQAQRVAAIAEATKMAASVPETNSASQSSECVSGNAAKSGSTKVQIPALSAAEKTAEQRAELPADQPQSEPQAPVSTQAPMGTAAPAADTSVAAIAADCGDEEREDLQVLRGIGPALHKKLNAKGVYRLKQLAVMDADEMRRLGKSLGVSQKAILKQDWVGQARALLQMPALSPHQLTGQATATSA